MTLKYSDVKEVNVVHDSLEANKLLKNGWILIISDTVYSEGDKHFAYVLGWTRRESPQEYLENLKTNQKYDFGF